MSHEIDVPHEDEQFIHQTDGPIEWPEPQPLSSKIDPDPYPLDALPQTIRAAVEEVLGFVQAPVPLIASSALAALSLATQAHFDIQRAEKLSGPMGLFILTIADSGERKSMCDGFFTQEIRTYEAEQAELAKPRLKFFKAAFGAWESKVIGVKAGISTAAKAAKDTGPLEAALHNLEEDKPEAPRIPRLIYADATPESLKWNLAKVWPSAGVLSSEAGTVFGSHGMSGDSVMRNLAAYNQLWDGADIATERRTSESYTVRGARLTIALQVQEATLRVFLNQTGELARGIGFLARCLVAWPESNQGFRPFKEPPSPWPHLGAFNRRIATLLNRDAPINEDGALTPAMLTFTAEGKAAWIAFHDRIEAQLGEGGRLREVRDVASKIADNAARMAALFHVFQCHASEAVDADSFNAAARIAEWHLTEARRFYGELALPSGMANAARLETWIVGYCKRTGVDRVPTKEVQRLGPGILREKLKLDAAVQELEELGRAQRLKEGKRKFIAVNPSVLSVVSSATAIPAIPATLAISGADLEGDGLNNRNNRNNRSRKPGGSGPGPNPPPGRVCGADWNASEAI